MHPAHSYNYRPRPHTTQIEHPDLDIHESR